MPSRQSLLATFTTLAQLAYAHGFFGNLYEATAKIPHRLAGDGSDDARMPSMFSAGSPVRYYIPGVPITVGSTFGALLTGWEDPDNRRWLAAAAASAATAGALTAYVVPAVNTKLFVAGHPLTRSERDRLLRTWYRLNTIRIVALGAGWLALQRVREGR
jgi:Domain of unknown function (DUF1772)